MTQGLICIGVWGQRALRSRALCLFRVFGFRVESLRNRVKVYGVGVRVRLGAED